MKKTLKWIGIGAACLVGAIGLFVGTMVWSFGRAMDRDWPVDEVAVVVSADEAVLARGEHVARAVAGCTDCHGEDLSGGTVSTRPRWGGSRPPT